MKQALVAVNGIDSVEVLVAHASNWTVRVRLKAVGDAASLLGAGNIRARWVDVVPSDLAILAVERDDEHANAVIVRIASDVPRTRAARMEIELTAIAGLVGDQGRIQFLVRTAPIAGAASEGAIAPPCHSLRSTISLRITRVSGRPFSMCFRSAFLPGPNAMLPTSLWLSPRC